MKLIEELLQGAAVERKPLGEVGEFTQGNGLRKKDLTDSGIPAIHYGQLYTHYGLCAERTRSFISESLLQKQE